MTEEKGVVNYKARDGLDITLTIEICKKYLVSGKAELVTNQEFMFFMATCKAKGMNPFIKDCYLVKYSADPAAIITAIEFYRKRSKAQEDCQGWKNGIIIYNKDGALEYRDGAFISPDEKLLGGWFECLPKGWIEPMKWSVSLKPYIKKTKEGNVTQFWQEDKQPGQIAKVAEAQGLRKVWPGEFEKLYVDAEIQSRNAQERLDNALNVTPEEDPAIPKAFAVLFFRGDPQDDSVKAFVAASAKGNNVSEYSIKEKAIAEPEAFKKALETWIKKQKPDPVKQTKKATPKQAEPEPELEPYPATIEDVEDLEEAQKVIESELKLELPPVKDDDFIPCEGTGKRFPIGKCKVCPVNKGCDAYGNYLNEHTQE